MINVCTIGFTKTNAESFFKAIKSNQIKTVIDTRINNNSQLAGFSKKEDIKYFLKEICDTEYIHKTELAPTKELLDAYRSKKMSWSSYEQAFFKLIKEREIEKRIPIELLENSCLLCSEKEPHHCHRRLVAEYLKEELGTDITIKHL